MDESGIRRMTVRAVAISVFFVFACTVHAGKSEQIIFLHYWTGPLSGGINEMVDLFGERNPEFRVRATGFEHESFKIGIKVMLRSGNPPDLFSYWAGARVQALVDEDRLAPIDGLWTKAKMDKRFAPAVAKACAYNGRKYAIPVTQHFAAFFYNAKIFRDCGIHVPDTWPEFLSVCEKLKSKGITPVALGSREKWPAQFWFDYLLLRTAGPEYRRRLMTGAASYTDAQVKKAFSIWKALLDNGCFIANPNAFDWSEASKMVFHGEAAMTLMGTWIIGLFDGRLGWKQGADYDFFPFPEIDPKIPGASVGPIDVIVLSKEGKVAEAGRALEYFSDVEPQKRMSKGSGALAPNRNIPPEFYSDLQRRIIETIGKTRHWAFNYDLATSPKAAEAGLECFAKFLERPGNFEAVLAETESKIGRNEPK